MDVKEFVITAQEKENAAAGIAKTEKTDAVNSGIVGSADKSKAALQKNIHKTEKGSSPINRKKSLAEKSDGSKSKVDLKTSKSKVDPKTSKKSGAKTGAKQSNKPSFQDLASSKKSWKDMAKDAGKKNLPSAFASKVSHTYLSDSELEGTDDVVFAGHSAYRMGKGIKKRVSGKDALSTKKPLGALSEKRAALKGKGKSQVSAYMKRAAYKQSGVTTTSYSLKSTAKRAVKSLLRIARRGIQVLLLPFSLPLALGVGLALCFVLLTALLGGSSNGSNSDSSAGIVSIESLNDVEAEVVTALNGYGFSNEAIAAIMGNMKQESGMNPGVDGDDGFNRGNSSVGLLQLTNEERTAFKTWCSQNRKKWNSVSAQIEWTFSKNPGTSQGFYGYRWNDWGRTGYYELERGFEPRFRTDCYLKADDFKNSHDVALATYSWMGCYERPGSAKSYGGDDVSRLGKRIEYAQAYFAAISGGNGTVSGQVSSVDWRNKVVAAAQRMVGGTYVYGGFNPSGRVFDCSGLTKWCYEQVGVTIAHQSESQSAFCNKPASMAEIGDVVWRHGHVGIYIGNGRTIEAMSPAMGITYGNLSSFQRAGSPVQ